MVGTEFEQPARRIGGGGGRGPLWILVWVVGLVAVVGIALSGRGTDDRARPDPVVAEASPGPVGPAVSPAPELLVLTDPSREVRTVALRVRGLAREPIAYVEVALVWVDTTLVRQISRPTGRGLFAAVFTIAAPRSSARVTVVATGRDTGGAEVASVRREVSLAAIDETAAQPRPLPTRPPIGEDGLMGSLAFDLSSPPPAPAPTRSPAPASWSWPVGRLGWQANPVQR
jgi:hypothetical protein